jgi:hypothetical protein
MAWYLVKHRDYLNFTFHQTEKRKAASGRCDVTKPDDFHMQADEKCEDFKSAIILKKNLIITAI